MLYRFGYLYSEYKSSLYYWEFVKILLRMAIIISSNIFSSYFFQQQIFSLLLFIIYCLAILKLNPYRFHHLFLLDLKTHVFLIYVVILNISFKYFYPQNTQSIVFSAFWMIPFLSYIIYLFGKAIYKKLKLIVEIIEKNQ